MIAAKIIFGGNQRTKLAISETIMQLNKTLDIVSFEPSRAFPIAK